MGPAHRGQEGFVQPTNINHRRRSTGGVADPRTRRLGSVPGGEALEPYYRFVAANVQEHTREDPPAREPAGRVRFMMPRPLPGTPAAINRSRVPSGGRTPGGGARCCSTGSSSTFPLVPARTAGLLDVLPEQHTAHYQHLPPWNMEPEHFKIRPEPGEQAVYQGRHPVRLRAEGIHSRWSADGPCRRRRDAGFPDRAQPAARLTYEIGGKTIYRSVIFDEFVKAIGSAATSWRRRSWAEDVPCPTEEAAARGRGRRRRRSGSTASRYRTARNGSETRGAAAGSQVLESTPSWS